MPYRLGGQLTDGGSAVSGQPVVVLDTNASDPTNWTIAGATTSDSNGNWQVTVPDGDPERYHAVSELDGADLKNALSKPFLTAAPLLQAASVDMSFDILSPTISVGGGIPDSGVSRYPFEQTVNDVWGSNDGTDNTSAGYTTDSYQGDYAKSFDGTDDVVQVGVNGMPTGDSAISILMWVKTSDTGIIWSYGNNSDDEGIGINSDTGVFIWGGPASGQAVNDGTWRQVGLRYQPGEPGDMDMIVDGGTINAYSQNINIVSNYHQFGNQIGDNNDNYLAGDIDDPRIYNKYVTDTEVSNHYSTGSISG